jgi:hypothetical protein
MKYLTLLFLVLLNLKAEVYLIDNSTALMWQDVAENKGVILTWDEAKEYCERLDLGGYDDWWLPDEAELATIVDTTRPSGRKIKKGFIHFKGGEYWTSSTYAWNAPHAWVISFENGASYTLTKEKRRFMRCVRCSDFKKCIEKFYM